MARRPRWMGDRARTAGRAAREGRLHHLHARLSGRNAAQHRRLARRPARGHRPRGDERRDRRLRHQPARHDRRLGRPALLARAHPARQHHPERVEPGAEPRPRPAARAGAAAADAQARFPRARRVLPAGRPHGLRHEDQRAVGIPVVRHLAHRRPDRHRVDAPYAGRPPPLRDRDDRAPRRRAAAGGHVARALQARHVDAPPERHERPARAALHGRGRGLPPADGEPAHEEADHAAAQAGPRLRPRRGALHPEPRRRRLQGAVERGHVAHRAAADRAGQEPPRRRPVQRCRRRRHRRGQRHDQQPRQAAVHAQARGQGRARGDDHALGDELSARAADARSDRPCDDVPRPLRLRRRPTMAEPAAAAAAAAPVAGAAAACLHLRWCRSPPSRPLRPPPRPQCPRRRHLRSSAPRRQRSRATTRRP